MSMIEHMKATMKHQAEEIERLEQQLRERDEKISELIDALTDMVAQYCYVEKSRGIDFDLDSNCLYANADAMRLLGKLGVIDLDDRGMRVVFGKWPKKDSTTPEKK